MLSMNGPGGGRRGRMQTIPVILDKLTGYNYIEKDENGN